MITGEVRHQKLPDVDNLNVLSMNAMTGLVYCDDKQLDIELTLKKYSETPGVEIKVIWEETLEEVKKEIARYLLEDFL